MSREFRKNPGKQNSESECRSVRSPISPSSVACGATFPTQGEGYFWLLVIVRYSADLPVRLRRRTEKNSHNRKKPSPWVGKVAPQATDEGETGERTHVRHSAHGFIPT